MEENILAYSPVYMFTMGSRMDGKVHESVTVKRKTWLKNCRECVKRCFWMVEHSGIEPLTSSLPAKRSPS